MAQCKALTSNGKRCKNSALEGSDYCHIKSHGEEKESPKIQHPKKAAMVQALESTLGVVTTAAKKVGIDRSTHYEWLDSDPEYKKAVTELSGVALDFAESQLFQQVRDGNTTATIFYLKTKGKERGYIERIETEDKTPQPKRLVLVEQQKEST